jgi:hypothetical protein
MSSDGKLEQLIKQKRAFLRQSMKDYSSGGNDMLDDVEAAFAEAKAELTRQLEVASCVREDEGEEAWQRETSAIFTAWFDKWFGKP